MIITNLEDGGKLATYEGVEDKPAVEALESEGLVQPSRYDKINWITSKRCIRPTWSVILEEGKKPRVYRLRKEALRRVKEIEGDIPLLAIEFQKDGQAIQQPVVISDSLDLNEYVVYLPFNTTDEKKISEWISSNPELISVTNGIVTVVEASDDPVTITAIAKEGIEASISVKGEVEVLANPTIDFGPTGLVTLACPTEGATIYYTTDGSDPTTGNVYSAPFPVTNGTTVKAVAKKGDVYSDAVSDTYEVTPIEVDTPTIQITDGLVTIECTTADSVIYYTIDNSTPDKTSTLYENSFQLTDSATVKAIAYVDDYASEVASESWVKPAPGQVATPSITPASGAYTIGTSIEISCSTDEAVIHYTTDGSNPSSSSPTYSSAITLEDDMTVKAIGIKDGMTDSNIASVAYTIAQVATPLISPAESSVEYGSQISISMLNPDGETIHYTTDGSAPNESSPVYSSSITVDQESSFSVRAIAFKANYRPSAIAEKTYTVTLPKLGSPTFSPVAGAVEIGDTVTITAPLGSDASIKYSTDDGSTWLDYSDAIVINTATTIKAKCVKTHATDSDVVSAAYTIKKVGTPSVTPTTVEINGTITLSCSPEDASIVYSVDGNDPSIAYTGPITVTQNANFTLKAKATKANWDDSEVLSQLITVTLPTCVAPTFTPNGGSVTKATEISIASDTAGATIYYTVNGSTPTTSSTEYSAPITINEATTIKAIAVKADYNDSAVTSKSFEITKTATPTFSEAAGEVSKGTSVTISCATASATISYSTDNGNTWTTGNTVTINSAVTVKAKAIATDYAESDVASVSYTVPAEVLYKYYGIYDETDDGTGQDVDPDYDLTQETIDSIFTSFAEVEDLVYNDSGADVKTVATSRVMGDSTHEVGAQGGAGEGVGCRVVYMYPAEFDDLTGATQNGFAYNLNDLTKLTVTIEDIPYFVYVTGIVGNNRTFPFSFS